VACSNVGQTCTCSVDGVGNSTGVVGVSLCPVGAGTSSGILQIWTDTCGFPQ
jgi:hypothetical protein